MGTVCHTLILVLAVARFVLWEGALFCASARLARRFAFKPAAEACLGILAIEVTLESSIAGPFAFFGTNAAWRYWLIGATLGIYGLPVLRTIRLRIPRGTLALLAIPITPLILLSFRPVEEIDSINYLHYLIDWMANRATPYTFATNFVAFWELSFVPVWMVTRLDLFFPLLALKAVVLMALAAWLIGRELAIEGGLLALTVFGALTMRHYWYEYSGVPTLKNDVAHGAGFAILTLVILRAARRELTRADIALLSLGAAFAGVKYTGIFFAVIAVAIVLWKTRAARLAVAVSVSLVFLATSGHFYLHNLLRYGSPFYPFQVSLGPIHLAGTADLSYSSILYNLHDPRLWRALFLPAGGISPAGLLFPLILAASLVVGIALLLRAAWRRRMDGLDWTALALLAGYLLYFRSVYGACAAPGDMAFILNGLNSVRYIDGVLAVSEIFLVAMCRNRPLAAAALVALNAVTRLGLLYTKIPFPPILWVSMALVIALLLYYVGQPILAAAGFQPASGAADKRAAALAAFLLLFGGPLLVEANRRNWTTYWNDLKPPLAQARGPDLAVLAVPDGGYFAGHVVAAGNPVDIRVRSLPLEGVASVRPRYVAVLVTPGSAAAHAWRSQYVAPLAALGYKAVADSTYGGLFEVR